MRTRLGWSRQRPARRAVERDEDAIVAWRENEWPRIKKLRGAEVRGSASRTKVVCRCSRWSVQPGRRRRDRHESSCMSERLGTLPTLQPGNATPVSARGIAAGIPRDRSEVKK
ncbi:winged helix-turn-helix domain-containing protein [Rhodococcus sp. NPDC019609]|uniref:winged helix-turn-helix domain-containing protein n=1 Tax=unclassified Rhodococcus (in: high G+C Gram-positive bacteria) TaxID=192944 RepID=UPI00340282A2